MANNYQIEKESNGEYALVISGFDQGVAPSPHKGFGNMQNVNLNTESGEAMCSFARSNAMSQYSGTINAYESGSGATLFAINDLSSMLPVGLPVAIGSGITGLDAGNYYIYSVSGSPSSQVIELSTSYDANVVGDGAGSAGSASFSTITLSSAVVTKAIEEYFDGTKIQYRYYILEGGSSGYCWVFDTGAAWSTYGWTPININEPNPTSSATGMNVLNGWLHIFQGNNTWVKMTCALGVNFGAVVNFDSYESTSKGFGIPSGGYQNPHPSYVNKANELLIANGPYIASVRPNSSTSAAIPNTWGYGSFTFSGSVLTITTLFAGTFPTVGQTITFLSSGTNPTNMTPTTTYYVIGGDYYNPDLGTFQYALTVSGDAATPSGGSGTFFFNQYSPRNVDLTDSFTYVFNPAAFFSGTPTDVISAITEISDMHLIGTQGNNLYQWDGISSTWNDIISLPEKNTAKLISVNNMGYAFAGNKGNIYITNGSTASLALTIPDYCAGIAGTPASYIEAYFIWGDADYIRGRIYFSIQDQTSSKAGNCGGVWSFIPTQNFFIGQDFGLQLKLENRNSYGTYNGRANAIIPNQIQEAIGTQYWTAWTSDVSTPAYGIDQTGTVPVDSAWVETDAIPTGTFTMKRSFSQAEYKLATPLQSGESVQLYYRLNLTDSWSSFGSVVQETTNPISGIFNATGTFQLTQWTQIAAQLDSNSSSSSSFVRLTELRLR